MDNLDKQKKLFLFIILSLICIVSILASLVVYFATNPNCEECEKCKICYDCPVCETNDCPECPVCDNGKCPECPVCDNGKCPECPVCDNRKYNEEDFKSDYPSADVKNFTPEQTYYLVSMGNLNSRITMDKYNDYKLVIANNLENTTTNQFTQVLYKCDTKINNYITLQNKDHGKYITVENNKLIGTSYLTNITNQLWKQITVSASQRTCKFQLYDSDLCITYTDNGFTLLPLDEENNNQIFRMDFI
jgi:hypothetical protein